MLAVGDETGVGSASDGVAEMRAVTVTTEPLNVAISVVVNGGTVVEAWADEDDDLTFDVGDGTDAT